MEDFRVQIHRAERCAMERLAPDVCRMAETAAAVIWETVTDPLATDLAKMWIIGAVTQLLTAELERHLKPPNE